MSHRCVFYYDTRSNLACVRDPDLGLTYYTYDAGSRMTSVQNPFGEVTYYHYRLDGQVSCRILGNGCVTYYDYDDIGRTTLVDNRDGEGAVISSFAYQRDAVGNPISIEREDGSVVYYEYDGKHQLTRETHVDGGSEVYAWEWDYDAAGNREFQVLNGQATYYAYNAANELLTETTGEQTTYYSYDACGNTTAKQEAAGTTYYAWDHENLMTRIDLPEGAHSYFGYDADSKRVSKRDADGFAEFVYQGPDMLRLLLERNEAGGTQVHYTMGAGLEAMRRADGGDIASGDSSFYHFDWLGSTFALSDDEQAVTDTYLYNAWGEVLDRTGTTENPHQWVGRERYHALPDLRLFLLGVRCYVRGIGRFMTLEPGPPMAVYTYVAGLPTARIDATGRQELPPTHETCVGFYFGRPRDDGGTRGPLVFYAYEARGDGVPSIAHHLQVEATSGRCYGQNMNGLDYRELNATIPPGTWQISSRAAGGPVNPNDPIEKWQNTGYRWRLLYRGPGTTYAEAQAEFRERFPGRIWGAFLIHGGWQDKWQHSSGCIMTTNADSATVRDFLDNWCGEEGLHVAVLVDYGFPWGPPPDPWPEPPEGWPPLPRGDGRQ